MEITEEKLDELIQDEKKAFIEYSKLGLSNLARDEKKHYEFLKRLKKRMFT